MNNQKHQPSKLKHKALIGFFILGISLPLLNSVCFFYRTPLNLFYFYEQNNFGFKENLIKAHGFLKVKIMNVSSSSQVILGKNDWLFYAGDNSTDNYLNIRPFSESELKNWADVLQSRQKWLEQRGIKYLFVVAPDKQTIYGEMLPEKYTPVSNISRLDQLLDYLRKNTNVEVVDLRPILKQNKNLTKRLYHKSTA